MTTTVASSTLHRRLLLLCHDLFIIHSHFLPSFSQALLLNLDLNQFLTFLSLHTMAPQAKIGHQDHLSQHNPSS